jgi:hypothetical protein
MKTSLWGRHYWFVFHVTALKYPVRPSGEDKLAFQQFYSEMWRFLPCQLCSEHYLSHLNDVPIEPYLVSRDRLFEWTVIIHNRANASIDKRQMPLAEAIAHYRLPDGAAYADACPAPPRNNAPSPIHSTQSVLNAMLILNSIVIISIIAVLVWAWFRRGGI